MKECPNPTCRAHQEHWGFEDIENYCPVCRERLVSDEAAAVAPTNVMAAQAAAANRPYIDSYMEVRNNSTTPIGLFVAVLAAAIFLLLLWLLISYFTQSRNASNTAATQSQLNDYATATAAIVYANATATALAAADVPLTYSGTVLPSPYATGVSAGGAGGSGSFPTATAAPLVESTPIPLALGGAALIHNIGMVASCTNSALKPIYHPNENFFVMVQADFSRTQVYEIHALWQMPPDYSTVIDARGNAMSIDNPAPGLKLRDGGMYYVCFQAIPPAPKNVWPVGNYRVDIYINNGALPVISKDFSVGQ